MRRTLVTLLAATTALVVLPVAGQSLATAAQTPSSRQAHASRRSAPKGRPNRAGRHRRRRHHHRRHHGHRAHRHHPAKASRRSATGASFECPYANLVPTSENLSEVRSATYCLVNRERVQHGDRPLQINGKLGRAAQGHSEDMVAKDYFSHYGPAGDTPASRMRATGYLYSTDIGYEVAENIAWGTFSLATPSAIVEAWMHSQGHRENILDPHYKDTGIGVVAAVPRSFGGGKPGAIYTQDFGVIITG